MTVRDTIQSIAENWFLSEPVFFEVLYIHQIVANEKMDCPIRSGKGRVEYNPQQLKGCHPKTIEKKLGIEMIRILLKHPYERQPDGSRTDERRKGSDMVIGPYYKIADLVRPVMYNLPNGMNYEWYVKQLMKQRDDDDSDEDEDSDDDDDNEGDDSGSGSNGGHGSGSGSNGGHGSGSNGSGNDQSEGETNAGQDYTSLWGEDQMIMCEINGTILSANNWGNIPGHLVEIIYQSTKGKIRYENVLRDFYASALSDIRRLSRNRPSRRFGFNQMGSLYKYMPKLIIALDCSGSVSSENLSIYLHVIAQFFKYGIQEIDVITFDAIVYKDVTKLKKAMDKQITIKGRGGTDFQPVIKYFCKHSDYDGMIIVTDGFAPIPQVPLTLKYKILWIIDNKNCYETNGHLFRNVGRVCRIDI